MMKIGKGKGDEKVKTKKKGGTCNSLSLFAFLWRLLLLLSSLSSTAMKLSCIESYNNY